MERIKVVVFGASGILGQTLRLYLPEQVEAVFCRRGPDPIHLGLDLTNSDAREDFLSVHHPDVIVNLAGENRVDIVEADPASHHEINVVVPQKLVRYCEIAGAHYVHISTQGVFSGKEPPYRPSSALGPVNAYGRQKAEAEALVREITSPCWTIVRPTFVLGIRPIPCIGRRNPLEDLLLKPAWREVHDRWFSPLFARDAAQSLWNVIVNRNAYTNSIVHFGTPLRVSRYEIARAVQSYLPLSLTAVPHDSFPGIAARPLDTTYAQEDSGYRWSSLQEGLERCWRDWQAVDLEVRARELSLFLGRTEASCLEHLRRGFQVLHADVADDFRNAHPATETELLFWYAKTTRYLWELSSYHSDPGFNYRGMCNGILHSLRNRRKNRLLILGDGIGDCSLWAVREGFDAVYHDLEGSRTADFAQFRFWLHLGRYVEADLTYDWEPPKGTALYDAIISLDFFEHLPNVEHWVQRCRELLRPGGLLFAQNAFAIGSGSEGSIPCHLAINDRFEKDWNPLLARLGFIRESPNWYRK